MKSFMATLLAGVMLIAPTMAIAAEIEATEDATLDESAPADEGTEDTTVPAEVEPEPTGERAVDMFAAPVEAAPAAYGKLSVTTDPTGAKISLDGNYIGVSPISGFTAWAGEYILKVERPEYFVSSFNITVERGGIEKLHFDLVKKQDRWSTDAKVVLFLGGVALLIGAVVLSLIYA